MWWNYPIQEGRSNSCPLLPSQSSCQWQNILPTKHISNRCRRTWSQRWRRLSYQAQHKSCQRSPKMEVRIPTSLFLTSVIAYILTSLKRCSRWGFFQFFSAVTYDYDFALVELTHPIDLTETSNAVAALLPTDIMKSYFNTWTKFMVSGWGQLKEKASAVGTTSDRLQYAIIPWVSRQECKNRHGRKRITPRMICAGSGRADACHGDSGGRLKKLSINKFDVASFDVLNEHVWTTNNCWSFYHVRTCRLIQTDKS